MCSENCGLHVQFVHVLQRQENFAQKRWRELKKSADLDNTFPLKLSASEGNISDTLLKTIEDGKYGTIIMGKRGLSGIKRWMPGSISAGVSAGLTDQTLFLID
jgi:2,4-dienoyl-CoA reductase (NADPH2)